MIQPYKRSRKDWVKGVNSPLVNEERQPSHDWTIDLCNYSPQKFKFDTNSCSEQSWANPVETQCNRHLRVGSFSPEALAWFKANGYFDENGRFDVSERFNAILAGTSINGGSIWKAWVTGDDYGILPWNDFHYSYEQSDKFDTQEAMCLDYYDRNQITQAMFDKAEESKKYTKLTYEWSVLDIGKPATKNTTNEEISDDLGMCPVQAAVAICAPFKGDAYPFTWNTGVVSNCPIFRADHGIMIYKMDESLIYHSFDHYQPAKKTLSADYPIYHAIKGVVTPVDIYTLKHSFDIDIAIGQTSPEIAVLQEALQILGYFPKTQKVTGFYGEITRQAVFKFQMNKVVDWSNPWTWTWTCVWPNKGKYCHRLTRSELNKIFK